jgi:hypothetical protein
MTSLYRSTSIIFLLSILHIISYSQTCQQHILSTVPATEWTTWQYVSCETSDTVTQSLPCCGWTLPVCAVIGTVELIDGDGFSAPLINEVGGPWESCSQYNENETDTCQWDLDQDGRIAVSDLLIMLANDSYGEGDLEGLLNNFSNQCE